MLLSVKEASPSTKIYVQSILPLSDRSVKYYKRITKEAVLTANVWIREVCASLSVPYIDTHSLLTDESGYLKKEYQNDEYMHLTGSAYAAILENIRKRVSDNFKRRLRQSRIQLNELQKRAEELEKELNRREKA